MADAEIQDLAGVGVPSANRSKEVSHTLVYAVSVRTAFG